MNRAGAITLLAAILLGALATADEAPRFTVPDTVAPAGIDQPLPYSHKTHLAIGLNCDSCHTNDDPGIEMGYPPEATCMTCHTNIASDRESIRTLKSHADAGNPVPWVRVYAIAAGVTWSHRSHTDAGVSCETCHGDVSQMDVMTEAKATVAMASCIGCHEAHDAPTDCVDCHSWPSDEMLLNTAR